MEDAAIHIEDLAIPHFPMQIELRAAPALDLFRAGPLSQNPKEYEARDDDHHEPQPDSDLFVADQLRDTCIDSRALSTLITCVIHR